MTWRLWPRLVAHGRVSRLSAVVDWRSSGFGFALALASTGGRVPVPGGLEGPAAVDEAGAIALPPQLRREHRF